MQNMQNMPGPFNNNNKMIMNYKQNIPYQHNYNNRYYNNINNNLINQNSINIINNNIDYINTKNNLSNARTYINNNNINVNVKSLSTRVKCTCSKTGCKKKYCACFSKNIFCEDCECKDCENRPQFIGEKLNNMSNNIKNKENIEKMNYSKTEATNPKTERVICNCTKSNCMKKYCECYKQGFNCNSLCRCIECNNKNYIINDTNNFYNYALNGKYHNIDNNNKNNLSQVHDFSTSYIPETFGRSTDYNNPINFQSEAFGIYIKKERLIIEGRRIDLKINNNNNLDKANYDENNINKIENLLNNFNDLNETPKFSNKKRLRGKNDNSAGINTCPTTNSSNRRKKGVSIVNKNIEKKRLKLN